MTKMNDTFRVKGYTLFQKGKQTKWSFSTWYKVSRQVFDIAQYSIQKLSGHPVADLARYMQTFSLPLVHNILTDYTLVYVPPLCILVPGHFPNNSHAKK